MWLTRRNFNGGAMFGKFILCTLPQTLRRFQADRGGNVIVTFALCLLPVFGLVGAAIDYSRANSARTALQAALDATALMMANDAQTLNDQAAINTKANSFFVAQFHKQGVELDPLHTTYNSTTRTLDMRATAKVQNTPFYWVLNPAQRNMPIGSSTQVKWGSRLRVALALDTTGSMDSSNKIGQLKNAVASTGGAIDQLSALNVNTGDVYISVVPFAVHVNPGSASYTETWIDWTQWEAPPTNWTPDPSVGPGSDCPWPSNGDLGYRCTRIPTSGPRNLANCVAGTDNNDDCISTIPSSGTYSGYLCPSWDTGRVKPSRGYRYYNGCYNSVLDANHPKWTCTGSSCDCGSRSNCSCSGSGSSKLCKQSGYRHDWIVNARSTWTGCVMDRGTTAGPATSTTVGNDQNADTPGTTADTKFPADQYVLPCPAVMRGLANDWSQMKTHVNNMSTDGATNQPIGLVWAWQSLKGGGPLTVPSKDPNFQYEEIIILLSDGLNTQDRWWGNGSSPETKVDDRMSGTTGTCQKIKDARITIYTVQVNTSGDPESALLKNCATDVNKYFHLRQAGEMPDTFKQIVRDISKLRIAR
jgi:Flp pilus assembly protein TadG